MQDLAKGIHNKIGNLLKVQVHGQIGGKFHQGQLGERFFLEKIF